VILSIRTIPAVWLSGMFLSRLVYTPPGGGNTRVSTKGWDDLDDTEHGIYPSSRSAWLYQNLSDGSSEPNSETLLDVRDRTSTSWTYGDIVVHKYRERESTSPGLGHRKRNLRNELRGPEVREAIMAGVVVAVTIALFLGGVVVGVMAVVAVAVHREDRAYTHLGDSPSRMSKSARRLNGLGRRDLDAEFPQVSELVH